LDGALSHIRRATQCFGCFIEPLAQMAADFDISIPEHGGLGGAVDHLP
jgi:hypothetical protein